MNDVDGEMVIKISDFGLSRIIGEGSFMKTVCGTPQYLGTRNGTREQVRERERERVSERE